MKKFTSMLMSALVLLQVGGNIAGAKDLSDTKIETISVKVPETNNKKFVVIQKENKGTSFGTKIVSIAGASILAGLGAFGVYKFVTRNKKTDDKDTKNKNKDEEETEKETPKDQTLKSKGTDLGGLSDEELEQLNSENNQRLSKYEGVSAHSAPPPMIKKLQDDKQQIQNEIDKRQRSRTQSQSQSSENASNRTLGIVKYNEGAGKETNPNDDTNSHPDPVAGTEATTGETNTNRTQAVVGVASSTRQKKETDPNKPKVTPGLINLTHGENKNISSITIYGTPDTLTIKNIPKGTLVTYCDRSLAPNFDTMHWTSDAGLERKAFIAYPDSGKLTIVAQIAFDKIQKNSLYETEEYEPNQYTLLNQLTYSNSQGTCLPRSVTNNDCYTSYTVVSPSAAQRSSNFFDLTNMELRPGWIHWRSHVIALTTKCEIHTKSEDSRVHAAIQQYRDYLDKPYKQPVVRDEYNLTQDAPRAILNFGDLKNALAPFGLKPVSSANYPNNSPLPARLEVVPVLFGEDNEGNPQEVQITTNKEFGYGSVVPYSFTVKTNTTLGQFSRLLKLSPGAKGNYPDTFGVVWDPLHLDAMKFYNLAAQTEQGGLIVLKQNSSVKLLEAFTSLKRQDQERLVSGPNQIVLEKLTYLSDGENFALQDELKGRIKGFVIEVDGVRKVLFYQPDKETGTLGNFFDTHNRTGQDGCYLTHNDQDCFQDWNKVLGLNPNLRAKPVKVVGLIPDESLRSQSKAQSNEATQKATVSITTEAESNSKIE